MSLRAWLPAALLLASCGSSRKPELVIAHRPPQPKDVIEAVLASQGVGLDVSSTCSQVGTESTDKTLGRYVAGFLAAMGDPNKKNWIETSIAGGAAASGEPVWMCNLVLRHEDGDDRWGWGVEFQVRQKDGVVLPQSYRCTGAG